MGGRGRGGGKARGRGGARHGGQGEGSSSRGRGRGRGGGSGGRGREQMQSGDALRMGFVRGGALFDWEHTTPDRRKSNGRGGRTPEGLDAGSRQLTSSNKRGSQNRGGLARPAQNPFAFVSFDYSQLDRRKGGAPSTALSPSTLGSMLGATLLEQPNAPRPDEVGTAASGDKEVVVPAIEGRVEVYMDRGGSLEALDALDLETRTRGLGFVDQESAGCTVNIFETENSGNIADSELNSVEDKNVTALEAMKVDPDQNNYLHLKTSVDDKKFRFTSRNKKNIRGSSLEIPLVKEKNAGYRSLGGVNVLIDAGITFPDDGEDLDEDSDVCVELDFASGKKRRSKGSKRFTSKGKESMRACGVLESGQWLENAFSGSGESIVDSSNSDIDDDLVADYMANVEGADEMLDDTWLLKNKLHHVVVEDMGSEEWENSSIDACGSDDDSSDSGCESPERMWSLKRQSKGKELMVNDDDDDDDDDDDEVLDFKLDDIADKILFGGPNVRHGRKIKTTSLLRNLELEDSEEDSEDEDCVDQLFDLMEDAHFNPDSTHKVAKLPRTEKQTPGIKGELIESVAWPVSVQKSKMKPKRTPGEKKRERKETIAAKRQERALHRGLDLQAINLVLEDVVLSGTDIHMFAPMIDRDRAQLHKMAAIYRLKSGSQGSGKKRFTVVTRTKHTSLPTGFDKYRLAVLLDQADGQGNRVLSGEERRMAKKFKNAAHQAFISMQMPTPKKNGKKYQKIIQDQNSTEKSRGKNIRIPKFANNPMSFISSGLIRNDEEPATLDSGPSASGSTGIESFSIIQSGEASTSSSAAIFNMKVAATIPTEIGTFEAHTKGFGSRMMLKMGFVEGQGLGRDRQGIYSPLEAVKRAKNLGLGAYAAPPPT